MLAVPEIVRLAIGLPNNATFKLSTGPLTNLVSIRCPAPFAALNDLMLTAPTGTSRTNSIAAHGPSGHDTIRRDSP